MRYMAISLPANSRLGPMQRRAPAAEHMGKDGLVEYDQPIPPENHNPHCSTIVLVHPFERTSVNVLPLPSSLVSVIVPPSNSANLRDRRSPRPVPSRARTASELT